MKIRVTAEHIKNGQRGEPQACPVALAIKEATGIMWITVGPHDMSTMSESQLTLPVSVQKFIRAFDHGERKEEVVPFDFEIDFEIKDWERVQK